MTRLDDPALATFPHGSGFAGYEGAALVLGRLDGMLALAPPRVLALFAHRLVDAMVIHALRSEQHAFAAARYAQWRAGLDTLALEMPVAAASPRLLAQAVLTTLAANPLPPLAAAARAAQSMLRAVADSGTDDERVATEATIAAGRALACSVCARQPSDLAGLALAAANDSHFAPRERARSRLELRARARVVERRAEPSPLWAIDLALGAALGEDFGVVRRLPFPGALPLAALRGELEPEERHDALARGIEAAARAQAKLLADSDTQLRALGERLPSLRSSSRAPELAALLLAVGPLSSCQIMRVLGASRLGVRGMLDKLAEAQVLLKERVNGTFLYSAALNIPDIAGHSVQKSPMAFSKAALDEFDAAMAAADAVLARSGRAGLSDTEPE